jgi:hypothetical protein
MQRPACGGRCGCRIPLAARWLVYPAARPRTDDTRAVVFYIVLAFCVPRRCPQANGKPKSRSTPVCLFPFLWNIAIYNHAYLEYKISMVVKDKANPIGKIRDILKGQNGILLTFDLLKHGIPRTYLSILEKKGEF